MQTSAQWSGVLAASCRGTPIWNGPAKCPHSSTSRTLEGCGMSEMIIQSPDEVDARSQEQHKLIDDMFDQVLHATDPQAREKPFVDLRQLPAVHETAEEMVVHPRVRREVDAIDSIVDARLEEEHEAKERVSEIEKLDITSQQFIDELAKLRNAVLDHAHHEETYG